MSIDTMTSERHEFRERFALVLGGATLLGLGVVHNRPSYAALLVASLGGIFLGMGTDWLRRGGLPAPEASVSPASLHQPVPVQAA